MQWIFLELKTKKKKIVINSRFQQCYTPPVCDLTFCILCGFGGVYTDIGKTTNNDLYREREKKTEFPKAVTIRE